MSRRARGDRRERSDLGPPAAHPGRVTAATPRAILPAVLATTDSWALLFHLLGAFLFVGGMIVAGVAFEAARRRHEPAEIALLLGLTRIGVLFVALGALVVLPVGLWLVHLGRFGYGAGWVDAALALFVAASVLGAIGGQRPKRARKLAVRLAREGAEETDELRALLDDRVTLALNYVLLALVVAIVMLMVFKPGSGAG